jgi:flagellar hook-basal body complex protein FliE
MSITNSISQILPVSIPPISTPGSASAPTGGFQSILEGMIGGVEKSQAQAQQMVDSYLAGGNEEIHTVALASQRASLEFELALQVRNKVVGAYQEVMRMQL